MSYYGWDGVDDSDAAGQLSAAFVRLQNEDINEDSLIDLNDSGCSFDKIADYLDRVDE
jgi:hypothetical protein